AHGTLYGFIVVLTAMTVGGIFAARKVLDTLARKLTPLPLAESLTASMTSAALVSLASWIALPVSTTHVTTGAIIGAGLKTDPKGVKWSKVGEIVLSWLITLPVAGLIAALAKDAKSEGEALAHYRRVRDEIRKYIETLPQSLKQEI